MVVINTLPVLFLVRHADIILFQQIEGLYQNYVFLMRTEHMDKIAVTIRLAKTSKIN